MQNMERSIQKSVIGRHFEGNKAKAVSGGTGLVAPVASGSLPNRLAAAMRFPGLGALTRRGSLGAGFPASHGPGTASAGTRKRLSGQHPTEPSDRQSLLYHQCDSQCLSVSIGCQGLQQ